MTPLAKLIFDALTFAEIAAGEGIGILDPKTGNHLVPEDFLFDYVAKPGSIPCEDDYATLAQRVAERVAEMEEAEKELERMEEDAWNNNLERDIDF